MPRDIEHRAAFESHGKHMCMLASKGGDIGRKPMHGSPNNNWLAMNQQQPSVMRVKNARLLLPPTLSIAKDANRIALEDLEAARSSAASAARSICGARASSLGHVGSNNRHYCGDRRNVQT